MFYRPCKYANIRCWVIGRRDEIVPAQAQKKYFCVIVRERSMSVQLWSLSNRRGRRSCRVIDRGRGHGQETALTAELAVSTQEGSIGHCNRRLVNHVIYDAVCHCQIYTNLNRFRTPVCLSDSPHRTLTYIMKFGTKISVRTLSSIFSSLLTVPFQNDLYNEWRPFYLDYNLLKRELKVKSLFIFLERPPDKK